MFTLKIQNDIFVSSYNIMLSNSADRNSKRTISKISCFQYRSFSDSLIDQYVYILRSWSQYIHLVMMNEE